MTTPGTDDEVVQCSAKGCRAVAVHVLVWNNPKLHTPDREKTWVACDRHRSSLAEHLDVRGFLRRVEPLVESQTGAEGSQVGGSQAGGSQAGGTQAGGTQTVAARGAIEAGGTAEGGSTRGPGEPGSDFVCSACGARFPAGQDFCPVCADTRTGSCGSHD